ncbi:8-amino-7-oxononanoate synthase [Halioglobus japonicus]|uniref:8-amino-7-oxononanoate synthase n=1 Tax=Halioglobus japonicus TaxID=930805 RepID=A0AAP8MCL6_9GAMM|nr:8-amino-7-oxononanoate synthase [Halioglobus japonicus]AQA17215.1 8-amino-7-oxononanoate synthase [Halioglobus japonicus]PLW85129.1 8-amino-7-oxononanoate synthase [Halioglobus japonicus]
MPGFNERLGAVLAQRRRDDLYRQRLTLESSQGPRVRVDGREYLNFCSNDYLGLAAHPQVVAALRAGAERYGVGSGASHLVCGHSTPHRELEEALAELTGRPRALLFSSGYAANTGTLTTLLQSGDQVFQDRLNHASLLDGGLHSGARFRRFAHNNVTDLEHKIIAAPPDSAKLVVVDGVFSMDGDTAPLADLAALCQQHNAWLMVDDAHGIGVMGEGGAGSVTAAGLDSAQAPVLMATLGKALGCAGAFVAGDELLIESLIQGARNYIYTTAMPPAVAAAGLAAVRLLATEAWRREHLQQLIGRFRAGAEALGLPLMDSDSAIQPLQIGDAGRAMAFSAALRQAGFLVGAIRPPTVPAGTSRLRITLTAAHTDAEVDALLSVLADVAGEQL